MNLVYTISILFIYKEKIFKMDFNEIKQSMNEDIDKAFNFLGNELSYIRAGRANQHILDKVMVEYYGSMTPLNQMANFAIPEAHTLLISVWDQSALKSVVKAIQESDIGINPTDDGKVIRLNFPQPTEERRKELVKQTKQLGETTKVNIRNARRDALEVLKNLKKDGEISEDDLVGYEKDIQKIIDLKNQEVDTILANKEKEIMEI